MDGSVPDVQEDSTVTDHGGNSVTIKWTPPENGQPPQGSIGVSLNHAEPFIIQQKAESGYWIITGLTPSTTEIPQQDVFFLVANTEQVHWVECGASGIPGSRIPCHRAGEYRNMFVGRGNREEIGMVVNYQREWSYYTGDINQRIRQDFQILCAKTDRGNQ